MKRHSGEIMRVDIAAFVFFLALFAVWLYTGRCDWLRYLYLALAFLYIFVVRIVVRNLGARRGETPPGDDRSENEKANTK